MNPVKWLLRILLVFLLSRFSFSADTITQHQFIKDNNDEVIVSGGKIFALGFFSPGNSSNRYVGIWYYLIPGKTVVWVANRDNSINDTSGILRIDGRGNLVLFQGNQTVPVWSTNISIAGTRNTFAQISDSGNLVLIQNDSRKTVLWQSFGYPTDTWISFMKIGFNLRTGLNQSYTSWKSPDDPGVGNYSFRMNPGVSPQMVFYKGSVPLWRSGTWTGQRWSGIPQMTNNFIFNDSFVNTDDEVSFSSDAKNASIITRWVANETGVTQRVIWNNNAQDWNYLTIPKEQCDFYGHCGPNGYCNPYVGDFECTCFPGFEPKSGEGWIVRDRTGGCVRKRGVSMCGNGEGFVKFPHAKVPDTAADALVDMSIGLKQCEEECLRNCSCIAYASANSETNGGVGCLTWHGDLMDARAYTETGQDLYIRVDKNDLAGFTKKGLIQKKGVLAAIIVSSAIVFLILVAFMCCLILRQRREARTRTNKNIFSFITKSSLYFEDSLEEKETDDTRRNGDLAFFDLSTIVAATDNFSTDNKLGQGGFGPVYKGVLFNGKEIAVKRLLNSSGQGLQEFKNEILLIAELQHRNLVRMLGCCIEDEEKILIYEFLPNKSLDSIIFDESKSSLLDWKMRFEIICGIARGMLYLHQDSRLRIIHRDLKASNVLLDAAMNPKISDFGMARIFGEDQTEGDTKRVVGTYGYMSPEYAMEGHFSIKSDVYSFGVLLLEIITGKKISSPFPDSPSLSLVGHVWEVWKEDRAMEVVDSALGDSYSADEILNCIQIGLLCVQEHAAHRPIMSTVVSMLSNEATLPSPEQPAFIEKKSHQADGLSSSGGANSENVVSISIIQAR
ncbi:G-type lectin S-receptor-like serine/threonine-protein kinase [Hibiscus syriacus]|uniref:Receptor-like serine/threonine-protein kinase n=1 Tax=Hibiscus syriacus TaxID=106335 RepID=A0A6A2Z3X7_HIBSY|nr:G-type lectin S-receptor-like serine/threonine-protein kinase [Hibiscus syriacus]